MFCHSGFVEKPRVLQKRSMNYCQNRLMGWRLPPSLRRSVQQEPLQFYLRELRRLALQLMANFTLPPCSVAVDQIGPRHQNVSRHETVITGDSTSYSLYCIFRKSG